MATGTPFHQRTSTHNLALAWKPWSGYFAATRYQEFHSVEYAAIRNGAALIDVSPLFSYRVTGVDAASLIDRMVTRDVTRLAVCQALYTPWCDPDGKVIQEGTIFRLGAERFQWNATEPSLLWLEECAAGFDVEIVDTSRDMAVLAVQGPRSRELLAEVAGEAIRDLGFFRVADTHIAGVPVHVARTGYTGDLGYEVWVEAEGALRIWDAIAGATGVRATPCGLLAMDVARIEAGFVLLGVDYTGAESALAEHHKVSPFEIGLGWAVPTKKAGWYIGREALERERQAGSPSKLIGVEVTWEPLEALFASADMMPELPRIAWRDPVPIYRGNKQVGRATSGCWSTRLKKMIALATVDTAEAGGGLEIEITVDYARERAPLDIVEPPFFRPARMRA